MSNEDAPRIPPFQLVATLTSVTPDADGNPTLRQQVTVEEYSETAAEHIQKNMDVANGIMGSFGTMANKALEAQK